MVLNDELQSENRQEILKSKELKGFPLGVIVRALIYLKFHHRILFKIGGCLEL